MDNRLTITYRVINMVSIIYQEIPAKLQCSYRYHINELIIIAMCIITSTKGSYVSGPGFLVVMFCLFACLSACQLDYLQHNKWICMKLLPEECFGPRNNPFYMISITIRIHHPDYNSINIFLFLCQRPRSDPGNTGDDRDYEVNSI